jgi:hypoxanthine phosphoribosyltransferase
MNGIEAPLYLKPNPKEVTIDGTLYIAPDSNHIAKLAFFMYEQIKASQKTYDQIICLYRGGLEAFRIIQDCTKIPRYSCIRVSSYIGIGRKGEVEIDKNTPLIYPTEGENILVIDDIADSGATMVKTKGYLLHDRNTCSVDFGNIYAKEKSIQQPNYFGQKIPDNGWVIHPGERREFIETSVREWGKKGLPYGECQNRINSLIGIGLPIYYVNNFFPSADEYRDLLIT